MTLILELAPETEARLRATALARGVAVKDAVREALDQWAKTPLVFKRRQ